MVIPFADILPSIRSGVVECAITGTLSGWQIGLNDVTSHVHAMAITWGVSLFGANRAAWAALPADIQALLRRELGVATVFNFLGPLANPAQPVAQAVGVADMRMAELMAGVFADRGNQGLVVHGGDGLDELTTTADSQVWVYADGVVTPTRLDPLDLGLPRATPAELVGGDAAHNAQVVRDLLDGRTGPVRDVVLLNAAATLVAFAKPEPSRLTEQLAEQLAAADAAISSGAARATLDRWVAATRAAVS